MGEVTDYVASLTGAQHYAVARVFDRARTLVPDAEEGRSYGMPALLHRGKALLAVVVRRSHIAVYPYSGSVVAGLAAELAAFSTSSGTIRFQVDAPLPDELVDAIVLARRDQIDGGTGR
jgi:uncharacterized protein YdhG (YjbR/CyaY superfamily)